MQTEAQKGYEYSTSSATYAVKPGGSDRIMADFRNLSEHLWRFSLPIELFLPYGSSCLCRPTELRASPPT